MPDSPNRRSHLQHRLARALLAVFAATVLMGQTIMNVGAAVSLVKFEAKWQNDGSILVVWETSTELNSTAFFVYRARSSSGPWTDYVDFEPAAGNEFTGATYSFVDTEVIQGNTYYYRLEETADDGTSSFYGPIAVSAAGTTSSTATSTATGKPDPDLPPTATRQYTNTPRPVSSATAAPTLTTPPTRSVAPARAAPTRATTPLVTTPTPIGGIVPTAANTPTSPVTLTPEPEPTATATETPAPPTAQATPSPTVQQLAAAAKEASQPLLDASTAQLTRAAITETPQTNPTNSRLVLFLGGGALVAAAALGAIALLIWRRRAG